MAGIYFTPAELIISASWSPARWITRRRKSKAPTRTNSLLGRARQLQRNPRQTAQGESRGCVGARAGR